MTHEEFEQINVGDKLVYTDLDKGIDHELVEVHPHHGYAASRNGYVLITKYVVPVHYSALEKYAEL